jgi:hypothetical protein
MDLSWNGVPGPLPVAWGLPRSAAGGDSRSALPSLAALYVQGNNLSGALFGCLLPGPSPGTAEARSTGQRRECRCIEWVQQATLVFEMCPKTDLCLAYPSLPLPAGPADPWPGGGTAVFAPDFAAVTQPGNPLLESTAPPPALGFNASADLSVEDAQATKVLLLQRGAISNWEDFAAGNNVTGWGQGDDYVPVCRWSGVTCSNGSVAQL